MSRFQTKFPALDESNHRVTSIQTEEYNCIAWAVGDDSTWFDPAPGYYWPDGVFRSCDVKDVMHALAVEGGFVVVAEGEGTPAAMERLAIYADSEGFTHVARQLPNGRWASKLGDWEDIEHATLTALEGNFYGSVVQYMQRPWPKKGKPPKPKTSTLKGTT